MRKERKRKTEVKAQRGVWGVWIIAEGFGQMVIHLECKGNVISGLAGNKTQCSVVRWCELTYCKCVALRMSAC